MGLQDIVQLNITLKSSSPTKQGFGRGLLAGYHTKWIERTRLYKDPDEMLADGFTTSDKLYKDALEYCAQRPRPRDFKVGRCALAPTQIIRLTPTVTTEGFVYSGKIGGLSFTRTNGPAETVSTICAGLETVITALAGVTANADPDPTHTHVLVTTDTPGVILQYTELVPELQVQDVTVDPGIATDLAAIFLADSDWFGLHLASNSEAEITAAATWIETKRRILYSTSADFGVKDPGTTTDILSDLKALDLFNTNLWYHHDVGSGLAVGVMAQELILQPGSYTMAHKSVPGVVPSDAHGNGSLHLTTTQEAAVRVKNGNTYTTIAGNGNTFESKCAGGDFQDVVRYIHFLFARVQERVIGVFQSVPKVPYTNAGVALITGAIQSVLTAHTKAPFFALATDPAPFVEAPDVATVDPADKAQRLFPDITFDATLTGAIHAVGISGTVSV